MYDKFWKYFTINDIVKGLSVAFFGSLFIYLTYFDLSIKLTETIAGVLFLYLIIGSSKRVWFWSGLFVSLFWFWWMLSSFRFYDMVWAIPIGIFLIVNIYGFIFWLMAWLSEFLSSKTDKPLVIFHAIALLLLSYIHPFGFDWFKPELVFTHSYIGIQKWQFAIVLVSIAICKITSQYRYLWLMIFAFAYQDFQADTRIDKNIKLITTNVSMDMKWQTTHQDDTIKSIYQNIDQAILENKRIVVLPESVFALFLNNEDYLMSELLKRSRYIDIIVGGLFWNNGEAKNSTYIFSKGKVRVIDKVVLVPFGERNPLPSWAATFLNKIFFKEGVIDYTASTKIGDYKLAGVKYRNAICYESTSEELYVNEPKNMIVISNNGWFVPSIEPALQRLLLEYYSLKYGTIIYHSINMSPSYVVSGNRVEYVK